jgi:pimeloyl-ACP methyl ester carboxylesterase
VTASLSLPWRHEYVLTNNIHLHYVTQGEGPLLILLHDFLEFWYSWRHQIAPFARHFKVVVPDLRGYNDSDKPSTGYDLETLSQDVKGLMEALGYTQANVMGHGWGGTIALHLAQKVPQSLNALILLASPHPRYIAEDLLENLMKWQQKTWFVLASQIPEATEWVLRRNLPDLVSNLFQNQAIRKGAFSREDTQIYQAALDKPGVLAAAFNYYRQFCAPQNLWRTFTRPLQPITLPTLVLWGAEDTVFSPSLAQNLDQWLKGSLRNIVIPQCGHWLQQEAPQTVNREVMNFLDSLPSRSLSDSKSLSDRQ